MSPTTTALAERADRLRSLLAAPELLVLPNAWDAASARLFADELGFLAVATTSHGVAEALGYSDHEATPPEVMFAAVRRITASVAVPVTADLEAGYGLAAGPLVESLLAAGAIGLNIEDTDHRTNAIVSVEAQMERLASIKDAGRAAGVDIVLNARIDEFIRGDRSLDEAITRARAYSAAGADCVYPIGLGTEGSIARFVSEAAAPVNILVRPGAPSIERLGELGVARVTWGGLIYMEALDAARKLIKGAAPR